MQPNNSEPFDCLKFEELVNDLLDQRESPSDHPFISEHAEKCMPCHQLLDEYLVVEDSMKLLKGDVDAILARAERRSGRRDRIRYGWIAVLAPMAALILLFFQAAPSPKPKLPTATTASQDRTVEQIVEDIRDEAQTKSLNTSPENEHVGMESLWDYALHVGMPELASIEAMTSELKPWLNLSSELPGIRPARGTVNAAIEFLRQRLDFESGRQTKKKENGSPDLGTIVPSLMLASA